MPTYDDAEFGTITIRRSARASGFRASITPGGQLRVSVPSYLPLAIAKRMVNRSRDDIRLLITQHQQHQVQFVDGMQLGKSHTLRVTPGTTTRVNRSGQQIIVQLAPDDTLSDPAVVERIRQVVITALRREAKSYLPKRLRYLADQHGFSYTTVRFSHAAGRWGSCSSSGTISLNIALMKLPFELIDYVLCHELAHTQQLNHSKQFWDVVATCDPQYEIHRRLLKQETPAI